VRAQAPSWWPADAAACFDDLVAYRLVGASACASRLTDAWVSIASESELAGRDLASDLAAAADTLCALKPDTALYRNLADQLCEVGRQGGASDVRRVADALSTDRQAALERVISTTCDQLEAAETLLVHDYSSTVMSIVGRLAAQRPRHIVVTVGEPLGQGERVARCAARSGHRITYLPDMSVARIIDDVDCFLTGVESFYSDGSLANTVGTRMLALLCNDAGVPVVAPAETLKGDLRHSSVSEVELTATLLHPWPAGQPAHSASWGTVPFVLDAVAAALITYFVTEYGKCGPEEVGLVARSARIQEPH
jgi:ribose 1,5-bisphosphate isomerase